MKNAAEQRREMITDFVGNIALIEAQGGSATEIKQRLWGKVASSLTAMVPMSHAELIERAADALPDWKRANSQSGTPSQIVARWQEWVPASLSCLSNLMDPALTRIAVMGQPIVTTNDNWGGLFHSEDERIQLAQQGKVPSSSEMPITFVLAPSELNKFAASFVHHLLHHTQQSIGPDGFPQYTNQMSNIRLCIDKDEKPIMCLIRFTQVMMCRGAVTIQLLTCTPLPSSEHLIPPKVPKSIFGSIKDFLWPQPAPEPLEPPAADPLQLGEAQVTLADPSEEEMALLDMLVECNQDELQQLLS